MGSSSQEDERLWDEALDLVIRLQNDPHNPVALQIVEGWRRRSPRHAAAWAEVAEIHGLSGRILHTRLQAQRKSKSLVSRRLVLTGVPAAAVASAAFLMAPSVLLRARADHMTRTGEIRRITLTDGSVVTLGPDSAIKLGFIAERRDVELLAGMAFFDVAPDPTRPFRVTADKLAATALGTAFEVSSDDGALTVCVDHGLVAVNVPNGQPDPLGESEWLTFDESTARIRRGRREANQIAAWRDNLIFADRETIASLVARIARWKSGRVIMADPAFGAKQISGVFDLTKPLAALDAVVTPYGGTVRTLSPYLTVISRF